MLSEVGYTRAPVGPWNHESQINHMVGSRMYGDGEILQRLGFDAELRAYS